MWVKFNFLSKDANSPKTVLSTDNNGSRIHEVAWFCFFYVRALPQLASWPRALRPVGSPCGSGLDPQLGRLRFLIVPIREFICLWLSWWERLLYLILCVSSQKLNFEKPFLNYFNIKLYLHLLNKIKNKFHFTFLAFQPFTMTNSF